MRPSSRSRCVSASASGVLERPCAGRAARRRAPRAVGHGSHALRSGKGTASGGPRTCHRRHPHGPGDDRSDFRGRDAASRRWAEAERLELGSSRPTFPERMPGSRSVTRTKPTLPVLREERGKPLWQKRGPVQRMEFTGEAVLAQGACAAIARRGTEVPCFPRGRTIFRASSPKVGRARRGCRTAREARRRDARVHDRVAQGAGKSGGAVRDCST